MGPGLNRQFLNVCVVSLSSSGLPVLWNIIALVTVPVAGSTVTTQVPFPLRLRRLISYVYSGKGAVIAMDLATESDTGTGSEMLAAAGSTAGLCRFLSRCFLSAGTATTSGSSAGGACLVGAADF